MRGVTLTTRWIPSVSVWLCYAIQQVSLSQIRLLANNASYSLLPDPLEALCLRSMQLLPATFLVSAVYEVTAEIEDVRRKLCCSLRMYRRGLCRNRDAGVDVRTYSLEASDQ